MIWLQVVFFLFSILLIIDAFHVRTSIQCRHKTKHMRCIALMCTTKQSSWLLCSFTKHTKSCRFFFVIALQQLLYALVRGRPITMNLMQIYTFIIVIIIWYNKLFVFFFFFFILLWLIIELMGFHLTGHYVYVKTEGSNTRIGLHISCTWGFYQAHLFWIFNIGFYDENHQHDVNPMQMTATDLFCYSQFEIRPCLVENVCVFFSLCCMV